MKLRLKNNQKLETLELSNNFKSKCTGLYITGCTALNGKDDTTNGKSVLDGVRSYQGSSKTLKNVRIDLPIDSSVRKFSGGFNELDSYTDLNGYNESGVEQSKPVFLGTWTINDTVSDEDISKIKSTFDSVKMLNEEGYEHANLVLEANFKFNWDDVIVQTIDESHSDTYNPAAAIIFYNHGLGRTVSETSYGGKKRWSGKYILLKEDVQDVTSIEDWFESVTQVVDEQSIVKSSSGSYPLTGLDALSEFTSLESIAASAFINDTELKSIKLPNTLTSIGNQTFLGCSKMDMTELPSSLESIAASAFYGCAKLSITSLPNGITDIETAAFNGCSELDLENLPNGLNYVAPSAFASCESIHINEIPEAIGYIGRNAFDGCSSITSLHLKNGDRKVAIFSGAFDNTDFPIFVGNGKSAWLDNRIKELCEQDGEWSSYSERLSSWFRKTYIEKIDKSRYDLIDYVQSDGIHYLSPLNRSYSSNQIEFDTDVGIFNMPTNGEDVVHGSKTIGLDGNREDGLVVKFSDGIHTIRNGIDIDDSKIHSYEIDLKTSKLTYDGKVIHNGDAATTGDGSSITFFGDSNGVFVGASWMNRIRSGNVIVSDFVPVYDKNENKVGFLDVVGNAFNGNSTYFSKSYTMGLSDENGNRIVTESGDVVVL